MEARIPAIHSYCDRWCERCAFTARCAVFSATADLSPEEEDPEHEAFWERLSGQFAETLRLLEADAESHGLTLGEPGPEEEVRYRQAHAAREAAVAAHPLSICCAEYAATVDAVLSDSPIWREKGSALAEEVRLGIRTPGSSYQEIELAEDCHQVIRWYQHFIGIKFRRALNGQIGDGDAPDDPDCDASGSAKVALLGVERSRLAFTSLFRLIPDEDRLLPLLALLERIEALGRKQFPAAHRFVRPGFDEAACV
ncbi:hypothetical protein [Flaviaesturariibacter amylovorans]|uniref:Uncharacterized protein n=1 Tax=Flaviaesturariibacter amylovorans TaxID=1084520 RepID=A0ABP8G6L0_9BACT